MKKLLPGAAGLALVAAVWYGIASGGGSQRVGTAVAAKGSVEDWYTEEGTITFGKEYRVIAEATGPVEQILVRENEQVKRGDVLFTIDATDYRYEKSLAESTLAGYEARLEQSRIGQVMTVSPQEYLDTVKQEMDAAEAGYQSAKTIYEGNQALYASGSISKVEQESGEAAYKAAQLAWQQARGRYEESSRFLESLKSEGIDQGTINSRFYNSEINQLTAQMEVQKTMVARLADQIGKCEVKAERDGIITSLPVNAISVIHQGETAAVLTGRDGVEAEADVLTNIAPYIRAGTPVQAVLQLRGQDEIYNGTVSRIYDYAARGTSSLGLDEYRVHVRVAFDEGTDLSGREGYGVNLRFLLYRNEDCLVVPSGAVFQSDGQSCVFGIADGAAVKRPVEVEYQTGTQTVIAGGLSEGEIVIAQVDAEGIYEGAAVKAE